ncbi:thiamine pyrophosphate-binding protein [Pseudonocardia acaciae]|uniref:thiamine pyrophosphate-binding protein n=1 Tax=Pseudonocardia acaciae TaxID=551276 RepID=UPI000686579E|nr:thiamine pyrophosphate-binding protein [Pseudonocardia acaciae]
MTQSTEHNAPTSPEPTTRPPTGNPRTGAALLVDCLAAVGVRTVFGVPGDTGVDLYQALAHQHEVRHVMARDERHAATMADAYARCSNSVGVVEVSSGGGATFSIGGLGEAYAASVPVLVISSDIHTGSRGTRALTEIDQEQLFAAVTKWRLRVDCAAQIPDAVREAVHHATSGRPAPVALIVPEDVLAAPTTATTRQARPTVPQHRPEPEPMHLAQLAADLATAKRPVIVAGAGIHLSGAWAALASVAERAACPVATTIHGKGAYPEDGDWSLGVVGANGGRDYVNEYVAGSDLALLIGTRANATDTNSFHSPSRDAAAIYRVDIDPDAPPNYPKATTITADARAALQALHGRLPEQATTVREHRAGQLAAHRRGWRERRDAPAVVSQGRLSALSVIRTLHESMPADTVIVADCGTPTPLLAADLDTHEAGRSILIARGHGPMGYAIPAAVGAALARPRCKVICITTDGSFTMACGELATAAALRLDITFIQFTNGSFGWIKMLQHLYYGRRYFGVDLQPVDSVAAARSFGIQAERVDSLARLAASVGHRDAPLYLDVPVPEQISEVPPVASWHDALAGDAARPVY